MLKENLQVILSTKSTLFINSLPTFMFLDFLKRIKRLIRKASSLCLLPTALLKIMRLVRYNRDVCGEVAVVVLLQHIGDVITCEPVSSYLKKEKEKKVVWVVRKEFSNLLTMFRDVDQVITVDSISECVYLLRFMPSSIEAHNLHFDGVYCKQYSLTLHNDNHLYTFEDYYFHGSLLSTFAETGNLPPLKAAPHLELLADYDPFPNIKGPFVAIHMDANDPQRMWELEKWKEFIRSFPAIHFIEIGLQPKLNEPNCDSSFCGKLSLTDIAYLIRKSSAFVGIESSVAHYSNALRRPSLVLMGSLNNFKEYTPYSEWDDNFFMLRTVGPVKNLSLDQVICTFDELFIKTRILEVA